MTEPKMSEHLLNLSTLLRENKEDEAKRLLDRVDGIHKARDDSQRGVEHYAAVSGCLSILQYAISMHPEAADSPDELGWTPLMIASSAGRTDIVKYLLKNPDVDVNHKNKNGQTALHYAASKNHKNLVHILLTVEADINAIDRIGHTPLHRAASQGHEQVVKMLIHHPKIRIDVHDSEGNTPLFAACDENREDIALALVAKGARLNSENKEGKTPLDVVQTTSLRIKLKKAEERANAMES